VRNVSEYDKGISAMVISCRSVGSYDCIASPDGFSYLPEGSRSLISSQHSVFPWWLIDDGRRDNIRSSFSIIWEEVAGFKFTGYWCSINWKGQCWRQSLVAPSLGSLGVLSFIDLNRTTGFCFERVDLVVCWGENVIPCLRNSASVPVS
jgi:hypothetical protein